MVFISFIILSIPIFLVYRNIIDLISVFSKQIRPKHNVSICGPLSIGLGYLLFIILFDFSNFKEYDIPLRIAIGQELPGNIGIFHTPLASEHLPTIITLSLLGAIGYFIIITRGLSLPPLVLTFSLSFIIIGSLVHFLFFIQILKHMFDTFYFAFGLFGLNYMICMLTVLVLAVHHYAIHTQDTVRSYTNKFLILLAQLLGRSRNWVSLAFILALPVLILITLILILFGQAPDALIKAFTETSDWTLSTKVSPPTVYYDGHYLCTVSASGHPKLVKPLRYGIRHNHTIIVNRQLLIANAFEQLIEEHLPRTHNFIRRIYDTYGYPIAKHMKTPLQCDLIYLLMKPLEYFFIIILYLFDKTPESRIARQYLPKL